MIPVAKYFCCSFRCNKKICGRRKKMIVSNVKNVFLLLLITTLIISFLVTSFYANKTRNDSFHKVNLIINNTQILTSSINNRVTDSSNNTKFILYWTRFWESSAFYIGTGYEPFKKCKYKNCYGTSNRSYMPVENFDAIIFHAYLEKSEVGEPGKRTANQRYIFVNMEAPVNVFANLKAYDSFFNWTMSYRFDSDLLRRNGEVQEAQVRYIPLSKAQLARKNKLAAWFVGRCHSYGKREFLVKELQKYIPVEIYGKCGTFKCKYGSKHCYDMVEKNYKFYFSFENAYCKDYSTEKLYRILQKNIVPVVYSGSDCNATAPPYSTINVRDFENAKDLANYLIYLDKNDDKYLEYFKWKQHYYIGESQINCELCKKLNEPIKQSVYKDIDDWWRGENKSYCKTNKFLPKIVSDLL